MEISKYSYRSFIFFFLLVSSNSKAQKVEPYKSPNSKIVTIFSKILEEDRKVFIHYPTPDTNNLNKRYPVLYLMDGESHFDMLAQYIDYLSRWDVNVIPEMIVVGITNTLRTRDLTPTESIINYFGKPDTNRISWMKPSGKNDAFLKFIKSELMPYVEQNYTIQSYKIFAGHSFGGLAAVNCLLTQPDMFDAYIAISPSFWWDNGYMLKLAETQLQSGAIFNKTIFYSDANEGVTDSSSFHTNLLNFDSILLNKGLKNFNYAYKYYPTESHMTEPMPAYFDALRFIYRKWSNTDNK